MTNYQNYAFLYTGQLNDVSLYKKVTSCCFFYIMKSKAPASTLTYEKQFGIGMVDPTC